MNTRPFASLITILTICGCYFTKACAQDDSPTLNGTVNISITKGTIACDFVLKDMPKINNNYVIRINSGMNIHYFKDTKSGTNIYYDWDTKDSLSSGETQAYFFSNNNGSGRFLPEELEIKYVGMYPIADSLNGYSVQDWRGNMAFNGYSVRADSYQSGWYPLLFDTKKQQLYEKVKYDITVNCDDCTTLFVTGSKPVSGTSAHFTTPVPQPLTMYCGKYEVAEFNGTYLLNPDMGKQQQKQFSGIINGYKSYYEKNLGIPYKDDITFIQTTPTAPPDHAFLFISYPTIVNIGVGKYGLNALFDKKGGDYYKPYLAHELAHYYFGTLFRSNTVFGNGVIEEGLAEYLSLKATKNLFADSIYQKILKEKIKELKDFNPNPIATIKTQDDFKNRQQYAYNFVPLVLTAIEKEIGEKTMWKWLQTILVTKADFTDYSFFEKTFDIAITDKTENERIKGTYFTSGDALPNTIKTVSVQ